MKETVEMLFATFATYIYTMLKVNRHASGSMLTCLHLMITMFTSFWGVSTLTVAS